MTLKAVNLKKRYARKEVIKGIDFELTGNKCIALLGANGAGKTTILQMLAGLTHPSEGEISVNDQKSIKERRRAIGYLPQYPAFYDWMTGQEFLIYTTRLTGVSKKKAYNRVQSLLETVGLSNASDIRISHYSGGMKQRLGIAQAITHQPKILLLDEPVSALDPIGRREVLTLFQQLKAHTTVLFSTHILHDAEEVSDEIIFVDQGNIVESGSLHSLREKYKKNKIIITFEEECETIAYDLKSKFSDLHIDWEGTRMTIFSEDCHLTQQLFMKEALLQNWRLQKIEMSNTSLEEMFIKVAKTV
jgi:ABC-2 type transport system ATP-binding protein